MSGREGSLNMLAEIVWNRDTLTTVGTYSIPIIAVVATFWSQVERRKSDNELKRSMVERGMSAEDIERIISAKTGKH